ncbi:MAG TPA: dihydrofolate reductase [Candidatus Saccharibacteria bacterium]|nr:dihydrofolate reductase [Candidatus Saccharibacteria bacterium]
MKSIVVAYDKHRGIGGDNDLLWGRDLPADLAHFKKLTIGKSIVMGRKTFESIGSRPLPNRQNIVVSRQGATGIRGVLTAASLETAYALAQYDVMVIGGGEIYRQALTDVDTVYATEVNAAFDEATVFFPVLDTNVWQVVSRIHHPSDDGNKYAFDFTVYNRVKDD